ncbi:DUF1003 domain-containing protein [Candidatus Woesearchaeota archaeon]|nr:DUF1003 domain-containing protein [Candidatus Woesearchaeota archaeon]
MFGKNQKNVHPTFQTNLTLGQRASDKVTTFFGSWVFIITLGIFLVIWITLNIVMWVENWDPYPFILLNLMLSCLAAVQAPIILMSQNRQAERDRINARYDYAVNRKAEREVTNMQKDLDEIKALVKGKKK